MFNKPNQEDIKYGQAIYTKKILPFYDLFVIKFSNSLIWHCPQKILINFFKKNISNNHLDIGVGTGYFLRKLNLKPDEQRIGLLDLNRNCLDYTKKRLAQFQPEVYQHDIFEPFTSIIKRFDSVSLNYVLHCLPGKLPQKTIVFDHIKEILTPGGKLFGATILGKGVNKNWPAEKLMAIYNNKKIFDNLNDDHETLLNELQKRFSDVQIELNGYVALFSGFKSKYL